jgi:hypothetical protein
MDLLGYLSVALSNDSPVEVEGSDDEKHNEDEHGKEGDVALST